MCKQKLMAKLQNAGPLFKQHNSHGSLAPPLRSMTKHIIKQDSAAPKWIVQIMAYLTSFFGSLRLQWTAPGAYVKRQSCIN